MLGWWRDTRLRAGRVRTLGLLGAELWGFLRDSTPERRRSRYGDAGYDWETRMDTTAGTVGWRDRLLGLFHSPYQPTDPAEFHEIVRSLPIDLSSFTFLDLGSGKGRALLLAAAYPFHAVVGVEILPALHRVAVGNLDRLPPESRRCRSLAALCADAADFEFPPGPLLVYLFNPLPEAGLRRVIARLDESLERAPRTAWLIYHHPLLESVVSASRTLRRIRLDALCAVYANAG